ncbi:hypothetical protein COT72_00705 [archaeon CG10_big_fil_rev_8_21_14_0_10_43_11]|nr:MAG: hypothetical protein COT72_00705 [archaeon CG10_big_fil_rev_8_21_14_0_10_43_11]
MNAEEGKEAKQSEPREEDEAIDVIALVKEQYAWFKAHKMLLVILALVLVSSFGFFIRTQNTHRLGENMLALDPWVFYRYAQDIVETGSVVANDTMRYYPDGYDTSRESTIVSYLPAYAYKLLSPLAPSLTLARVMQYYPPVATVVTLIFLFMLGMVFFNWKVGLFASSVIAVAPGFLFRTIAGFADKDALSMTFLVMSIAFYMAALKEGRKKWFYAHAVLAGISIALLGMTWGGYLFAAYSIVALNLFKVFTSTVRKKDIILQIIWIAALTLSDVFTNRYAIFKELPYELALLALVASLIEFYAWPHLQKRVNLKTIPTGVISLLFAIIIGTSAGMVLLGPNHIATMGLSIVTRLGDPLGGGEAMGQSVSENQQPFFDPDWRGNVGYLFYLAFFGAIILFYEIVQKVKAGKSLFKYYTTAAFTLFLGIIIFSRYKAGNALTLLLGNIFLYSITLFGAFFAVAIFFVLKKKGIGAFKDIPAHYVLLLFWFLLHTLGARGAVRLFFPFLLPAAIIGAYSVVRVSEAILKRFKDPLYAYIPYILIIIVLGVFVNQSWASSALYGPSVGGEWKQGFDWIAQNTPEDAVFVHWWDYGYWIQSLGNRTTVTDGGNAYPYRNFLMGRHLFGGYSLQEVYDQLVNFSSPDYFYVVSDDIGKFYQMARIGERNTYYSYALYDQQVQNTLGNVNATEYPNIIVFKPTNNAIPIERDFTIDNRIYAMGQTYVTGIILPINEAGSVGQPLVILQNAQYGQEIRYPQGYCAPNSGCTDIANGVVPGYVDLIQRGLIWIPEKAKDMFMTQAYLLNREIPGFEVVFETASSPYDMQTILGSQQNVRIYKINYTAMEEAIAQGVVW